MNKTKETCPRCDHQGLLFNATIIATGEKVVVCDECEALWKKNNPINITNFIDMEIYLESQGLKNGWKELQIENEA